MTIDSCNRNYLIYLVKDFFDFSSVVGESSGDGVPSEEHGAPLAANRLGPLRLLGLMAIRWRAAA